MPCPDRLLFLQTANFCAVGVVGCNPRPAQARWEGIMDGKKWVWRVGCRVWPHGLLALPWGNVLFGCASVIPPRFFHRSTFNPYQGKIPTIHAAGTGIPYGIPALKKRYGDYGDLGIGDHKPQPRPPSELLTLGERTLLALQVHPSFSDGT